MIIRKKFEFTNKHIVRNCSSSRCKYSRHSHTYQVEVFLKANGLDNGQMIMDFGLFKNTIGEFIKSFNNTFTIWNKDDKSFISYVKETTERVLLTPYSPSAEMLSLMMFYVIDKIVQNTEFNNGEKQPELVKVRVHETITGYAESTREDLEYIKGIELDQFEFSEAIIDSWKNPNFFSDLEHNIKFKNPIVECQVNL